jgi:hypothetical protein
LVLTNSYIVSAVLLGSILLLLQRTAAIAMLGSFRTHLLKAVVFHACPGNHKTKLVLQHVSIAKLIRTLTVLNFLTAQNAQLGNKLSGLEQQHARAAKQAR